MKFKNKVGTVVAVCIVAIGVLASPLAASAEEPVTPETTDVAQVEETAPATEAETTPVVEESAPVVEEQKPVEEQTTVVTTPPFEAYEACAWWETTSVNQTWPQTTLSKDCNFAPEARCEPYQIQYDEYWIRDEADKAYFESLTGLNSSADDQSLEPHDYYVTVIAAKDCTPVVIPANPTATVVKTCWTADFTLANVTDGDQTGSYVAYVDGVFHEAYTVLANETLKVHFQLHPGVGAHTVTIRSGPAQGDVLLATAEIKNDCPVVIPPTEEPPVVVPPVTPPTEVPTPEVTETPAPVTAENLAETGGESSNGLLFLAGLLFVGSATIVVARRIKASH